MPDVTLVGKGLTFKQNEEDNKLLTDDPDA